MVLAGLAAAMLLVALLVPPHDLLDKADRAAFAVCHRISERTFSLSGRPLPLCARCSGVYLGALAGLVVLLLRGRGTAGMFPRPRFQVILGLFVLAWAIDGLNSYLTFFPMLPHLYQPMNSLRLLTGTLQGLVLAAILLPVFNLAAWAGVDERPVLDSWRDLAWMLAGGTVVITLVSSGWDLLLYPLALLSGLVIIGLFGILNSAGILALLGRAGRVDHWHTLVAPYLAGLAMAAIELALIGLGRDLLTAWFGLPF